MQAAGTSAHEQAGLLLLGGHLNYTIAYGNIEVDPIAAHLALVQHLEIAAGESKRDRVALDLTVLNLDVPLPAGNSSSQPGAVGFELHGYFASAIRSLDRPLPGAVDIGCQGAERE